MGHKKTIGILGGMGPEATMELFKRIILFTGAKTDQEHLKVMISNDPTIPDRTRYILNEGISPLPKMKENLLKLVDINADIIYVPCMTAHSFISELKDFSPIPVVNGIKLIDQYLSENPSIEKVVLFATKGSYASKVFQKNISKPLLIPDERVKSNIMNIIYGKNGIKSGNTSEDILNKLKSELDKFDKPDAVIAGCTELGLVLKQDKMKIKVIDPLTLMAKHAVKVGKDKKEYTE